MKRFVPLLLALALNPGSSSFAANAVSATPTVDPQVMQSDREFLQSQTNSAAAAPAPEAAPPAPAERPEPIATRNETNVVRVAPKPDPEPTREFTQKRETAVKREAAPKLDPVPAPTSRVANRDRVSRIESTDAPRTSSRDRVSNRDPYDAPRITSRDRIVLGDPVFDDPEVIREPDSSSGITFERRDRADDGDRYYPREDRHRKVLHIGRFIQRLLPF